MTVNHPIAGVIDRASVSPDSPALCAGPVTLSRKIFLDNVRRAAAVMRRNRVGPGSVVAISAAPALHAVLTAAAMHEGAATFSARPLIVRSHSTRITALYTDSADLARSHASSVLVNAEWLQRLGSVNARIQPRGFESVDDLAHIVFSSGTTGIPKGVPFTVADLYRRTAAANDNWMPALPFFSELGLETVSGMQTFFWSLFTGEPYLTTGNAEQNAETIAEHRVRSIKTSPAKLADLVAELERVPRDVSGVEVVEVAGSVLGNAVAARARKVFDAPVIYLYGSTEVGTVTRSNYEPTRISEVGRVVPDAELLIVDDSGRPVPHGETGTIRIRTPYMATAYWNAESENNRGFSDGWFIPGDTGHLTDRSALVIDGRIDELVNAAGIKLDPAWIDVQIGEYRGVTDFASFALRGIDGSLSLALAFVSVEPINIDNFTHHLRGSLGDSMPTRIFRVDEIPRNALGKVARMELAAVIATALR